MEWRVTLNNKTDVKDMEEEIVCAGIGAECLTEVVLGGETTHRQCSSL
jgi:hypothetical protein